MPYFLFQFFPHYPVLLIFIMQKTYINIHIHTYIHTYRHIVQQSLLLHCSTWRTPAEIPGSHSRIFQGSLLWHVSLGTHGYKCFYSDNELKRNCWYYHKNIFFKNVLRIQKMWYLRIFSFPWAPVTEGEFAYSLNCSYLCEHLSSVMARTVMVYYFINLLLHHMC